LYYLEVDKKMDYVPAYISIGILFIIGVFLPLMLQGFIDVDSLKENESVLDDNSILDFLPRDISENLYNYSLYLGLIPTIIRTPLVIIMLFGFIYTGIKILPLT